MLYEPETMYAAARELHEAYLKVSLPSWEELSWDDKDDWQARADELNEAREDHIQ